VNVRSLKDNASVFVNERSCSKMTSRLHVQSVFVCVIDFQGNGGACEIRAFIAIVDVEV